MSEFPHCAPSRARACEFIAKLKIPVAIKKAVKIVKNFFEKLGVVFRDKLTKLILLRFYHKFTLLSIYIVVRILKTLAFWQKMMYCIVNMKKIQKIIITTISAIILAVQSGALAFANEAEKATTKNAIIPDNWGINEILNMILTTLTAGLAVLATGSIIFAGFLYMTAGNNASQVQKAKTMIFNTVIGIIAYVFMWTILEWLIPGGVL